MLVYLYLIIDRVFEYFVLTKFFFKKATNHTKASLVYSYTET
jgi:hypothetical protein